MSKSSAAGALYIIYCMICPADFVADSALSTERSIFIVNVIFRQKKFVAVD